MVLLSFFLNILATLMFLNLLLRKVHLSLSRTMVLMHSSRFLLSDMEMVVWVKESSVCVLFGLVVISCFFCGGRGVRIGNVEWGLLWFFGGRCCFVAATLASSAKGGVVERGCGSGLISRWVGSKWKSFVVHVGSEDRILVINWDHDGFMVDVDGVEVFSWSPSGPVIGDIEVSSTNEGTEEVEIIVVGVHVNENNSVVGAEGKDGRGGES